MRPNTAALARNLLGRDWRRAMSQLYPRARVVARRFPPVNSRSP